MLKKKKKKKKLLLRFLIKVFVECGEESSIITPRLFKRELHAAARVVSISFHWTARSTFIKKDDAFLEEWGGPVLRDETQNNVFLSTI